MSRISGIDLSKILSRGRLRLLATAALASISFSTSVSASTIQEPGYTETVIDSIAAATNGYGGMITDDAGNLYYAANEADQVYIVPPSGTASQFGDTAGNSAQGLAIIGTTLYSSYSSNNIYGQDLQQASPTGVLVATLPSNAMGMAVVPVGYGGYGGQLAVGTNSGISIVDPSNGSQVVLWNAGTNISDVGFTLDGRLVALRESTGELLEVTSTGVATVLAGGMSGPDGLAVQPTTGEIYVTDPGTQSILKIQADGSAQSVFATNAQVDSGYYPSPITFTIDGADMYYGTRESGSTIYQISGFDTTVGVTEDALPVPSMSIFGLIALLLALTTAGFFSIRRRSN